MEDKYKYSYINDGTYCYPDTDILINKLNIRNEKDLYDIERKLVSLRVDELIDNPIKGNFDFQHLKSIHKFLFQDIYKWAGVPRTCAIAKKDLFCLPEYINSYAEDVFGSLIHDKYFIGYNYNETIDKLVNLFSDINALHPFREGNGRSQREFIEELAKINGIDLDLTRVQKVDMIIASHEAVNGHNEKLYDLFTANANDLSKEEQIKYINLYCSDDMIEIIKDLLN